MKARARAPIIEVLHFTKEEIAEVKRIQTEEPWTKRKERLRNLIGGPMCSICSETPSKRIYYNLQGVTRIEAYCDKCFLIYERNKDVSINDIAETYNCTIAPPNTFGGSKIKEEGYSTTQKSSLSDHTIICSRCRVTRIFFDETQRGYNNVLIPLEVSTLKPHQCSISLPFFCQWCDTKLYFDRKVTNLRDGLIALEFETDLPHVCPGKKPGQKEVGYR